MNHRRPPSYFHAEKRFAAPVRDHLSAFLPYSAFNSPNFASANFPKDGIVLEEVEL